MADDKKTKIDTAPKSDTAPKIKDTAAKEVSTPKGGATTGSETTSAETTSAAPARIAFGARAKSRLPQRTRKTGT